MKTETARTMQPKVLVVNDDANELSSLVSGLRLEGFLVSGTTDAHAALQILSDSDADYSMALIDLMIPNINGLQLARKIRSTYPNTRTILMSDYILSPVQLAKAETGAVGFISKPCHFQDVAGFIKEKLASYFSKGEASSTASTSTNSFAPYDILSVRYSY